MPGLPLRTNIKGNKIHPMWSSKQQQTFSGWRVRVPPQRFHSSTIWLPISRQLQLCSTDSERRNSNFWQEAVDIGFLAFYPFSLMYFQLPKWQFKSPVPASECHRLTDCERRGLHWKDFRGHPIRGAKSIWFLEGSNNQLPKHFHSLHTGWFCCHPSTRQESQSLGPDNICL